MSAAPRTLPAVLIPTYNNVGTVGDVAARAARHGLPVYVVDDGCTDGSGDAARAAGVQVIVHPGNRGKGQALLTGMARLRADGFTHAICLDADGQHEPDDIPAFAAAVLARPHAIYAGVRDLATAPEKSRFGRRFSNFWIWVETGWRVADSQCGFRAYPIDEVLALGLGGSRYDMEVEVLTRCLWRGVPVLDLPCRVWYPKPEERVTSFDPLWDNVRISWMNTRLVVRRVLDPRLWPAAREKLPWSGGTRGVFFGWRGVIALLKLVGRKPIYPFLQLAVLFYWLLNPAARAHHARFLARAGARPGTLRGFSAFASAMLDRLSFLLRGPGEFTQVHDGVDPLVTVFEGQTGAVLLSAHFGNIEVSTGASGRLERLQRIRIVRFMGENDPSVRVLELLPETWRPKMIAVNRGEGFAALDIVRELRAGKVVAMHGDRKVDDRTVRVDFLGHPVDLPSGPWLVAALARVPVIVVANVKETTDRYRMLAAPPMRVEFVRGRDRDEQVREWAQAYADVLAAWVRKYPDQWYNYHGFWAD